MEREVEGEVEGEREARAGVPVPPNPLEAVGGPTVRVAAVGEAEKVRPELVVALPPVGEADREEGWEGVAEAEPAALVVGEWEEVGVVEEVPLPATPEEGVERGRVGVNSGLPVPAAAPRVLGVGLRGVDETVEEPPLSCSPPPPWVVRVGAKGVAVAPPTCGLAVEAKLRVGVEGLVGVGEMVGVEVPTPPP
jgi:hypothetical protein